MTQNGNNGHAPFNATAHLTQIKTKDGLKDYLPVQWRLVWLREQCPDATITTELIQLDLDRETEEVVKQWNDAKKGYELVTKRANGFCIFKATITNGIGGSATGYKSEKAASFSDYVEKCETGAVGRALAMLGYGTAFTGDELASRVVDKPVKR